MSYFCWRSLHLVHRKEMPGSNAKVDCTDEEARYVRDKLYRKCRAKAAANFFACFFIVMSLLPSGLEGVMELFSRTVKEPLPPKAFSLIKLIVWLASFTYFTKFHISAYVDAEFCAGMRKQVWHCCLTALLLFLVSAVGVLAYPSGVYVKALPGWYKHPATRLAMDNAVVLLSAVLMLTTDVFVTWRCKSAGDEERILNYHLDRSTASK